MERGGFRQQGSRVCRAWQHTELESCMRPPMLVALRCADLRVGVAHAVGVKVCDAAVGLLAWDQVPVLAPHDDGHFRRVLGDLVANVTAGLARPDDEHALPRKHLMRSQAGSIWQCTREMDAGATRH